MKGSEITTEEVAEKIAELIVNATYISKTDLMPRINAYLKAFVKVQSIPKFHPRDLTAKNIASRKKEAFIQGQKATYYASELCKIIGNGKMAEHNKIANSFNEVYNITTDQPCH